MATQIARKVLDEIHAHAESTYPEECCGLLIADNAKGIIESIRVVNVHLGPKHERYDIDPLELFRADRAAASRGLSIAGIYHSHPDYSAAFSAFDLRHSFPWYSYVVVSVQGGKVADTKSWTPSEDRKSAAEDKIEVSG